MNNGTMERQRMKTIPLCLSEQMEQEVETQRLHEGEPNRSAFVRKALREYLDRHRPATTEARG